jgi:hypothetical protein
VSEHGMNPEPQLSYGIASRLQCGICGSVPEIMKATGGKDGVPITVTAACCGQKETKTFTKEQLSWTQIFFEPDVPDDNS